MNPRLNDLAHELRESSRSDLSYLGQFMLSLIHLVDESELTDEFDHGQMLDQFNQLSNNL